MTAAIITVVILVLVVWFSCSSKESPEMVKKKAMEYIKESEELELRNHYIIVKGIEYRKEQARTALEAANVGDPVELVKEPDNEFDKYAVKVCYNGVHVGYIPRDLSREVSNNFERIQKAVIRSAISFTRIPCLNIEIEYYRQKGLSEEAVEYLLHHNIK